MTNLSRETNKQKGIRMKTKSLKGKWGHVGAPPKKVKYPNTRFTVERAVKLNPNVCELTVRKRIAADIESGALVQADVIRQPKKGVGRPKFTFIRKELAGKVNTPKTATKRTRKTTTPAATPVATVTTPVVTNPTVVVPVTPTAPAVDETPAATVTPAPLP